MAGRGKMNKDVSIRYTGDTKDFKAAAAEATKIIKDQSEKMKAAAAQMHSGFSKVSNMAKSLVGVFAAAFSVRAIVNVSKESMKLAAEAEGVMNAYGKLGVAGKKALDDITKATRGTIDQSDLMALTLKAQNFKIPLQDLAKYLEFATNRAITTGGSITELSNKIVEGLGRKSSRSFVALGISSKTASEAFKESGGMLKVINDELEKMGSVADTATVRQDAFTASVKNLKEAWGGFLNNSELVKKSITGITGLLQDLADRGLLRVLFESKAETARHRAENAKWDVTRTGEPLSSVDVTPIITPVVEETGKALKSIQDYVIQIKAAGVESQKQAEAWKIIHKEISDAAGATGLGEFKALTTGIKIPTLGTKPELERRRGFVGYSQEQIDLIAKANEALMEQAPIVGELTSSFENMFANMDEGFRGMIDAMIQSLKKMVAYLAAKAAVFMILRVITGGTGDLFKSLGGFSKFVFGGGYASGTNFAPGGLSLVGERGPELVNLPRGSQVIPMNRPQRVEVFGSVKVKGKDLNIVFSRYNAELVTNT